MNRFVRRLGIWCALFGGFPMLAQTLRIASASGSPGDNVALNVSMDSPSGVAPTILKWEMIFPAQLLEIEGNRAEVSAAAKDLGKTLTCASRQPYVYVCVLAGGQKPIANGPIASFRFKIRSGAHTGVSTIRVDHVDAATKDLQSLKFAGSEGHVEIK